MYLEILLFLEQTISAIKNKMKYSLSQNRKVLVQVIWKKNGTKVWNEFKNSFIMTTHFCTLKP